MDDDVKSLLIPFASREPLSRFQNSVFYTLSAPGETNSLTSFRNYLTVVAFAYITRCTKHRQVHRALVESHLIDRMCVRFR